MDIGSASELFPDDDAYISSSLMNGGRVELSSDSLLLYILSQFSDIKPPYSNFAKLIISSASSLEDLS